MRLDSEVARPRPIRSLTRSLSKSHFCTHESISWRSSSELPTSSAPLKALAEQIVCLRQIAISLRILRLTSVAAPSNGAVCLSKHIRNVFRSETSNSDGLLTLSTCQNWTPTTNSLLSDFDALCALQSLSSLKLHESCVEMSSFSVSGRNGVTHSGKSRGKCGRATSFGIRIWAKPLFGPTSKYG